MLDAWYLPGYSVDRDATMSAIDPEPGAWFEAETPAGLRFRTPRLSANAAAVIAATVCTAAARIRGERSTEEIVLAIAATAARVTDPRDPAGTAAVRCIEEGLGWSAELARETLAGMADIWTADALWSVIRRELPTPGVLDGFDLDPAPPPMLAGGSRRTRAVGPPLLLAVHAGNVPGVQLTGTIRALLVRSGSLNRVSSEEPGLLSVFARALQEEDPLLGQALAVTWWPRDDAGGVAREWVRRSGKVVVYGSGETVSSIRSNLPPNSTLIPYGPKLGLGVVLEDASDASESWRSCAEALARDACAYGQRGCVSPRTVYLIGDTARASSFCEVLAEVFPGEVDRVPRPPLHPAEAIAIRSLRAEAEFAGYEPSGRSRIWGSETDLSWTVVLDPEGLVDPEPLQHVLRVTPVSSIEELTDRLEPIQGYIQAIGYCGRRDLTRLAELGSWLGASRLAPFGTIAWPPADWQHDGRGALLPLLQRTDWEDTGAGD
jgi:hypothetical protein